MEINANRLIGREMVPMRTDILAIEPTSACNLKCSFCAYVKKDSPKITMKNDRFADFVGQAVAMGYRRFHLTPNTGDIFMDKSVAAELKRLGAEIKYKPLWLPDLVGLARTLIKVVH